MRRKKGMKIKKKQASFFFLSKKNEDDWSKKNCKADFLLMSHYRETGLGGSFVPWRREIERRDKIQRVNIANWSIGVATFAGRSTSKIMWWMHNTWPCAEVCHDTKNMTWNKTKERKKGRNICSEKKERKKDQLRKTERQKELDK